MKSTVDLAYPEVIIDTPSIKDVQCLMSDYAGSQSETTAVMQYMFQAYVVNRLGEDWHKLFEDIAISEMHHHEMLGETIVQLGGTPILGDRWGFWNGRNVNYTRDLVEMIKADIKAEKQAIDAYRKTIRCLDNFTIKELIERIILDEELHIAILEEALIKAEEMKRKK